ncbi:arrestin domain-containing protein 3-like [Homalodisca vitripennis]|uniref:arrestin domain-containing protein 3-like n=1 Tax=Homalodisca vitripennis TaxID=197043 RepID=UPI001EECA790|nr:arrestin domain-containing protein 3-like [Homalodisca vitripennis]
MGIENFKIVLDIPNAVYYAGSVVSGKLQFRLNKQTQIRGVKLHFLGEAKVSFKSLYKTSRSGENPKHEVVTFCASEEYFSIMYYLLGSSNSEMQLLPGEYVYPFTTTLPTILPSSFESEHGKIRYFIKAKVEIPWGVDFKVEKTFSIKTNVDLNNIAEAKKPIKRQVEKTFCCMWCRSGPLTMVLNLPQAGYVPGQNIPVILEVDNASNVDVDNVVIKLQKVIKWKASVPESKTKTDIVDLVELSIGGVRGKGSKTFTQQFSVPVVPVYSLHPCSIMTCDYIFKVKAETGSCHVNLTQEVPVFLGTVPVYKNGEAPPVDSSESLQQSHKATMPMTQPPFNPSMPTTQQPFNPSMPTAQQPFNPSVPTAPQPFNPSMPNAQQPFNPSMPTAQQPLNPSMPTAQQPFNPMQTAQQSFNPSMPTAQQPFNPSLLTAPQPYNYVMPTAPQSFNPSTPMAQQPFNPSVQMAQQPFNPSMPMTQNSSDPFQMPPFNPQMYVAQSTSNPSAEFSSSYLTPLLPKPIMPMTHPPNQGGRTQ